MAPPGKKRPEGIKVWLKVYGLGTIAAVFLEFLYRSLRWQRNDLVSFSSEGSVIGAFWHGQQLMMGPLNRTLSKNSGTRKNVKMLISSHADGRMIAWAVRLFGIKAIHGSSSQGGTGALLAMKDALRGGTIVAITPDGPRGPVHQVKPGVVSLASITQCPIIPIGVAFSKYWQLKSWDKMIVPKPFAKAVCVMGEPIFIPENTEGEAFVEYQHRVKLHLDAVVKKASKAFEVQ